MRYLKKFNEDFDSIFGIISNVEDILLELKDFGFICDVDIESNKYLDISIKKTGDQFVVFFLSDVKGTISHIDEYLTLGEGLKFESINTTEIPYDEKEYLKISDFLRLDKRFINLEIRYNLPTSS